MSARGEYRSIHTVLLDSPEFLDLSPEAQLVWFHLKLRLGPSGIDSMPGIEHVLQETTGLTLNAIGDAMGDAIRGAWLVRERSVLWLRNGLKFDPTLSLSNKNHMAGIAKHLQSLPKLQIVNDFASYYNINQPFPELCHTPCHADGIPHAMPIPYPIREREREREREEGEGRGKGERENQPTPPIVSPPLGDVLDLVASGPEIGTNGTMQPNELLAAWIDRQAVPPDAKEKSRQAGKAKQLCQQHARTDIAAAFVGMGQLYPYSNGDPWDLFDLDRKFTRPSRPP